MKRFAVLIVLLALASGTSWAGVRLDWDDSTGSAKGRPEGLFATAGTGGEASALVLGEVPVAEQTPSLTFLLPSTESNATQTPSLTATLTSSLTHAQTLTQLKFDASASRAGTSPLALYEWDTNGDGIFEAATASPMWEFAFADDGIFFAQVRVTDESGRSDSSEPLRIVVDNRAPAADFETSADAAIEGAPVLFDDRSLDMDGRIVSWSYDFGDGSLSSDANPSHTYDAAGRYQVLLTVIDDDGASSHVAMQIEISNAGPQAAFTLQQSTVSAGESLIILDESYDPSADGSIIHIAWDFGDGSYLVGGPSSDSVYSHTYTVPGTYTIELFVIDNDGSMARAQSKVTVI